MKNFIRRTGFLFLCIVLLSQSVLAAELVPVGEVIGIELSDGTVSIAAFDEALEADPQLQVGDRIVKIDDTDITCLEDVRRALDKSDGTVTVALVRQGKTKYVTLHPHVTAQGPKLGVYLKQGITGVGTVTWYDPQTKQFGALGHGVNSQDGELVNMHQGKVYRASVLSIRKGVAGEPGQLMGSLSGELPIGTLDKNTNQGIFGTVQAGWQGKTVSTCPASQVKTGQATILSTIHGKEVQEYSVEILKIYPKAGAADRNMLIRVTDPALLQATGGIVQGMSGSPILQDGRLIGAVTHVLVNDPTTGYGIFIDNMLDAA